MNDRLIEWLTEWRSESDWLTELLKQKSIEHVSKGKCLGLTIKQWIIYRVVLYGQSPGLSNKNAWEKISLFLKKLDFVHQISDDLILVIHSKFLIFDPARYQIYTKKCAKQCRNYLFIVVYTNISKQFRMSEILGS